MSAPHVTQTKNLVALAVKLERFERRAQAVDANEYRELVKQLKAELAAAETGAHLEVVLATFPATAELYENMNYELAGLCRSDLDASLKGEIQAREAIAAARSGAKGLT